MNSVEHPRRPPITMVHLTDVSTPVQLPRPLTPFVGRRAEIAAVLARIQTPGVRLLNLSGPGGIGKTRLAIAVAAELATAYPDGIRYVPLVTIADPAQVPHAVASALGLRESGRELDLQIAEFIGHRRMLLVLDNVEQIAAAGHFMVALLTLCPALTILTTSRIRLHVLGENEYPVRPMHLAPSAPDVDPAAEVLAAIDAIALFLERARAAGVAVTDRDLPIISAICDHLEGLPLGIELTAPRLRLLSPQQLLDRLRNPLEVMTGGAVDMPPHQRTMRETIAWSYDLLDRQEQRVFRALSTFAGGFTLDAAAAVLDGDNEAESVAVLDLVGSLVDQSLLRRGEQDEPRLTMLLTVREFGQERLIADGEFDIIHRRHAQWALEFAERAATHLTGPDAPAWLLRLDDEQANIRLAFAWFADHDDRAASIRLALSLEEYWLNRARYSEAAQHLERALAYARDDTGVADAAVRCMLAAAWLALRGGDGPRATELAESGLALARAGDNERLLVRALNVAAGVARRADDHQQAFALLAESRQRSAAAGDRRAVADALRESAYALMNLGRMDEALTCCRESIAYFDEVGNAQSAMMALDNMSLIHYLQGDYAEAHRCSLRAIEVFRRLGYTRGVGVALCHLGLSATHLGDVEAAWGFHLEELDHRIRVGDARGYAVWLEAVALLLAVSGDGDGALTILATADLMRARARAPLARTERGDRDRCLELACAGRTEAEIAAATERGRDLTPLEAIDLACRRAPAAVAAWAMRGQRPSAGHGLSAREEEILQLLVRRMSDREIAEALFISRHTVARHVASILRKLHVTSRHDAARIAVRS